MDLSRIESHSFKTLTAPMGGRGGGFEVIQFLISTPTNYLQKYQIMDSPLTKSHSSIKHFTLAASTEEGRRGGGSDAEL